MKLGRDILIIVVLVVMLFLSGCGPGVEVRKPIIYLMPGQSREQFLKDDKECKEWAEEQVPEIKLWSVKHALYVGYGDILDDYDAAYCTCMEARGYKITSTQRK